MTSLKKEIIKLRSIFIISEGFTKIGRVVFEKYPCTKFVGKKTKNNGNVRP